MLWAVLEIQGDADGLLDAPLVLRLRGGGAQPAVWRARLRDDDGRVWRCVADRPEDLGLRWRPAKPAPGTIAALQSLRPVRLDVRAELPDGRSAARTVTRRLVDPDVRIRRWRDGLAATLHLPAGPPAATVLVDATASPRHAVVATLAAPLLATHGVRVLNVFAPRRGDAAGVLQTARDRLAGLADGVAGQDPEVLPVRLPAEAGDGVVLPPGVPLEDPADDPAARRAAWAALQAGLIG